jgi:hypothetical protein
MKRRISLTKGRGRKVPAFAVAIRAITKHSCSYSDGQQIHSREANTHEGRASMKIRLATSLLTLFLVGIASPAVRADDGRLSRATLKGLSAIYVMVEDLPEGAKILGLSKEAIQTDVELKLRLAGISVVTQAEDMKLPGNPALYVVVNLTDPARAASIDVEVQQNAMLERNNQWAPRITTWSTGMVVSNPTAQGIRDYVKDHVDTFLNAWLFVNPKQ